VMFSSVYFRNAGEGGGLSVGFLIISSSVILLIPRRAEV